MGSDQVPKQYRLSGQCRQEGLFRLPGWEVHSLDWVVMEGAAVLALLRAEWSWRCTEEGEEGRYLGECVPDDVLLVGRMDVVQEQPLISWDGRRTLNLTSGVCADARSTRGS